MLPLAAHEPLPPPWTLADQDGHQAIQGKSPEVGIANSREVSRGNPGAACCAGPSDRIAPAVREACSAAASAGPPAVFRTDYDLHSRAQPSARNSAGGTANITHPPVLCRFVMHMAFTNVD